jgi:hypothetical protein
MGCPGSPGMGVRNAPELVSALLRFECPESAEYATTPSLAGNEAFTSFIYDFITRKRFGAHILISSPCMPVFH